VGSSRRWVVLAMRTSKRVIFFIICCWKVEVQSHGGRRVVAGGRCGVVLLLNLWSTRLYSDSTFWLLVSLNLAPQFLAVMWKVYRWNVLRELLEDVPFFCVLDVLLKSVLLLPNWGHMRNFLVWMFSAFECPEC
jgi:hypothetical protein